MARALLAQVGGCPVLGDVRYGDQTRRSADRMEGGLLVGDHSVALYAYRLYFDRTQLPRTPF